MANSRPFELSQCILERKKERTEISYRAIFMIISQKREFL